MSLRWVHWGTGMILFVLAGVMLLLQVSVSSAGTPPRACGSAWDAVAGLAGIAILVADPSSPLFLYVSRPLAAFAGLLLLLPAILLTALGQGISLTANYLAHPEPSRETS